MSPDIVLLVFVSLTAGFVVIQLGKTRPRGIIPLVAGIGAAVFSYTRYSMFAGLLDQPPGMFDSQVIYLQYFWLGSILLWIVVAGWGLTRVLSSAPLSGGAGSLREHEKAVTPTPRGRKQRLRPDDGRVGTGRRYHRGEDTRPAIWRCPRAVRVGTDAKTETPDHTYLNRYCCR